MFYLFAILFGMTYGGVMPLQTLISRELYGLRFLGGIMAVLHLIGLTGGSFSPPLAGYIFDRTGGYEPAFILCIIFSVLTVVLSLILLRLKAEVNAAANGEVSTLP